MTELNPPSASPIQPTVFVTPTAPGTSTFPASSLTPNGMVRVKIEDVNMPFWAMVGLMIKISLASIPAFIILFVLFFVLTLCASMVGLAGLAGGGR